jgi:hypothetical protein
MNCADWYKDVFSRSRLGQPRVVARNLKLTGAYIDEYRVFW